MVAIREATLEDVPRIVSMGARFLETPAYSNVVGVNRAQLEQLVLTLLQLGVIYVAALERELVGFIALAALAHPLTGELYADEIAWWIEPEHRQTRAGYYLLRSAEDWARQKGCVVLKMVSPAGSDVGMFYERRGYVAVETAYQKRLT